MDKQVKTEIKFYPMMVLKAFTNMKPGAYTGQSFEAKPMDEICEMTLENLYMNVAR